MTLADNDRLELVRQRTDQLGRPSAATVNKQGVSRFQRVVGSPFGLFLVWPPFGFFLIWAVIMGSVAAYLADTQPEIAIQLRSTNPTALLNLATAELKRYRADNDSSTPAKPDPEARAKIGSWAKLALRSDPLNPRAFRLLGQLSAQGSNEEQTMPLMAAAAHRSLRESDAIYWMMQKSYRDEDYRAVVRYADTLLRTRPSTAQHVMPILGKLAEHETASVELKQLLLTNPPWRAGFLDQLPANISDARTPLEVLLSLKDSSAPPTPADLRSYLNFLISHRFHELAYYAWLQFLPAEQISKVGLLFNGEFEFPPSGLPFDWTLSRSSGVAIKVAERPDKEGDHALLLDFGVGRVELPRITQLVTLAPGRYRFQGTTKVDVVSQRGLQWRITCVGKADTQLGESSVVQGTGAGWQDFSFSFTVPETDCPAQEVQLVFNARWASEQFISGSIWYDDLRIVREL